MPFAAYFTFSLIAPIMEGGDLFWPVADDSVEAAFALVWVSGICPVFCGGASP